MRAYGILILICFFVNGFTVASESPVPLRAVLGMVKEEKVSFRARVVRVIRRGDYLMSDDTGVIRVREQEDQRERVLSVGQLVKITGMLKLEAYRHQVTIRELEKVADPGRRLQPLSAGSEG